MPDVRLIDANALMKSICEYECGCNPEECDGMESKTVPCNFYEYVNEAPTIEAQPVKHGKWVRAASGELNCSYCGYAPKWDDDKFCANCGAKMDGKALSYDRKKYEEGYKAGYEKGYEEGYDAGRLHSSSVVRF